MCDECLKNFHAADQEVRDGAADRVRAIGSAMCQAALDAGYDPLEILAALASSERYFRKQYDPGLLAVADEIATKVAAAVEAAAPGGKLAPRPHSPLRFEEEAPETPDLRGAVARGRGVRPQRRLVRGRLKN